MTKTKIIYYDNQDEWENAVAQFAGWPDKSESPYIKPRIGQVCQYCKKFFNASNMDFSVNKFVVCPYCDRSYRVHNKNVVVPDIGQTIVKVFWKTKIYNQ